MSKFIQLGDIRAEVTYKAIKNIHLSVYPPQGAVRISAPGSMGLDTIRVFALSKLGWIKKQQQKLREQERETPREYIDRESHYVNGERYLLRVQERDAPPRIRLTRTTLELQVRPGSDRDKRKAVLDEWMRQQLKVAMQPLLNQWQQRLGVTATRVLVQRMKTRWGGCNPRSGIIRINLELAKKPPQCLEYIIVHELMHLIEPTHNNRFVELMDAHLPRWRFLKDELNRLPVSHEEWGY
ncbi:M48 family metallopeptidase [Marinobacterium sp. D7]|uniref:M48 family metallopeptidase n=1 Tax=Marinobacterium ramblicola TaxID=2849041 RepID=UPI001C2D2313|nr:SprT family zinc-dependent metalloprotease [Marinobacterium ramblicola]MBV1787512.1 M48 family metallopeptidase [Marinobacterium ramblicola]